MIIEKNTDVIETNIRVVEYISDFVFFSFAFMKNLMKEVSSPYKYIRIIKSQTDCTRLYNPNSPGEKKFVYKGSKRKEIALFTTSPIP